MRPFSLCLEVRDTRRLALKKHPPRSGEGYMFGRVAASRTVKAPHDSQQDNVTSVLRLRGTKSATNRNELGEGP